MGARGPLPQPTNVRFLRGNPGRRAGSNPVKTAPAAPNPPERLDREARAEWRRIVPELDRLGVLGKVDRAALAMYCDAWSRWVALARRLDTEGLIVTGYRGVTVKNPAWQLYRDAGAMVVQLAQQLGVTPAARQRLRVTEPEDPDDGSGILD
ncbi:phage terminase small subunit P27 family [Pseudonocardia hispaniensis]|uniref:Phage terminase small subunit P27 family n=1 Tax=Pseudonocardia hispaniensis TaxID=904933 RepID=A0ABW1IYH1_9PSEU